jgi:hypothetical protein
MKDLFKKRDADFCSLIDYVKTFIDEKSEDHNIFQLPPIQRNSVWNVSQIERLWDSILRGFPIGSFLVSPRQKIDKARDLDTGEQKASKSDGYFLLDGQQRTRAVLLGFKANKNIRLWIDLNPNLVFDNVELNDRKYLLRAITTYQPWGMSDRNPTDKLNENQKFYAREELGIENLHYDYQVKIDNGNIENNSDKFSWPLRAELPIPLDDLINLCGGITGKFISPEWKDVCKLIPERYHILGKVTDEPTHHYKQLLNSIRNLIDIFSETVKARTVVLLYQNEGRDQSIENEKDPMEVLFVRVNSSGTVLNGEEMSYSLLKSSWDGAYEMVSHIVQDKSIGYLLSSTGIVMAATRLARFIQNKNDVPNPGIGNFRKWIGEKDKEKSFLEIMQSLLLAEQNSKSKFHETLEAFCELVLYREENQDDIGIPKKLLLAIKPSIFHPVLTWIYCNNCNNAILEQNRNNVLRYLIYCFLTVEKSDRASKKVMEILKQEDYTYFPDKIIYDNLLKEELSAHIPTPNEFAKPFEVPADGFFRHWNDVFNILEDPFNSFRNWFWTDSKELLLWFQRKYTSKWFKGYDPTSNDAFDTPYDWDHIVPYSHLITSGAPPDTHSTDKDLNNKFKGNRHLYVNSIGNYRLWPFWANRSDNNTCHTYKLRMEEPDWENDLVSKKLGLISSQDFFKASAIDTDDKELWYNAGGDVRNWPEERRKAWQTAVERRVCYLYEQIYSSFKFNTWTIES